MAINFPNNPNVNDTFIVSGTIFTWTGVKWKSTAVTEISSDASPQLGGNLDLNSNNITGTGNIDITGTLNVSGVSTLGSVETTSNGVNVTGSVSNTGIGTTSYLRNVTLEGYSEKLIEVGNTGASYTYTLADGNWFKATLDQTSTFTFDASNAPSQVYSFVIQLKNGTGGPFSITWPASVEWSAGVTPTRTTTDGRTDIWSFITTDGGTNWLGNLNIVNYNV